MDDREPPSGLKTWMIPLGLAVVTLLLAGYLPFTMPLIFLAGFFVLIAIVQAALPRIKRERYDLNSLREFHEREELLAIGDELPSPDADTIVCPRCGNDYRRRFPACPNCGFAGFN